MTFLDTAKKAAVAAGKIHLKYFEKITKVYSKSAYNDKVTIADIEAEKAIVKIIKAKYKDHNILAEEEKYPASESDYCWIIDPLDGTNNFSHAFPQFCVSIALSYKNEIILGIVHDALHKETFIATKGKGSTLNGKKIFVSGASSIKDSMLITGFPYQRGKMIVETLQNHQKFFDNQVVGIRRLGSAALDLCYIASGRADGFWEPILMPWDFAAGKLIIEEAGGKITDKLGNKLTIFPSYIVASNGHIHDRMIKIINN